MARVRSAFTCSQCGHTQGSWFGRCPSCRAFSTAGEQAQPAAHRGRARPAQEAIFEPISAVDSISHERIASGNSELDRVLGGGLVPGSYLLVAGEPGAGKTTLVSELLLSLARAGRRSALVCGEESKAQVRLRLERLGLGEQADLIHVTDELSVDRVCAAVAGGGYELIAIDSIQTLLADDVPGAPGSISQVRECGQRLLRAAKEHLTTVMIVGQVTKDGEMAGPRALEHMVDAVLMFEGDRREQMRLLRAVKNRFGSTDEVGVFEMTERGLVPITDPSGIFAPSHETPLPGACASVVIEGTRPLVCEVQALVNPSNLPQPIRGVRGLDSRRAQMLLAVLSRKAGFRLGSYDVFLNVAAGLRVDEPAVDLAVCLAVAGALTRCPVKERLCALGEVSLLGEVRPPAQAERRRREAERLGYVPYQPQGTLAEAIAGALGPRSEQEPEQRDDEPAEAA